MMEENALDYMHSFLEGQVKNRDLAVDATLGTGRDSLYLKDSLKIQKIYGFDIQKEALDQARERLGDREGIQLIQDSHENMSHYIHEEVDVVCFNLGYLPGGDKTLITKKESTCRAIEEALKLLREGGLMTILLYRSHKGAQEEVEAVLDLLSQLDQKKFLVHWLSFPNQKNQPAYFLGLKKRTKK